MKTLSHRLATTILVAACVQAPAAPSTELPHEFVVPHETGNGFSIVDKDTGQVQHYKLSGSPIGLSGPFRNEISNITSVCSGYDVSAGEKLLLSSTSDNRIALTPLDGSLSITYQGSEAGPQGVVPLHRPGDAEGVIIHTIYTEDGHGIEFVATPDTAPGPGVSFVGTFDISSLQPLRNPDLNERWAVSTFANSDPPELLEFFKTSPAGFQGVNKGSVPTGSRLATEVRGTDGRICTLAYVPGSTSVRIFTHGFNGFSEGFATAPALPFPVGSISQISPGIPNAPDGVLITSKDGSTAIYAGVVTGSSFTTRQTFSPGAPSKSISGMVAIPGEGIIQLFGTDTSRRTLDFRFMKHDGTSFTTSSVGFLPAWLPPATEFATLFWFDATPLINPGAQIVRLQPQPDWTNGAGNLPTPLSAETFGTSATGLDNPSPISPPTPSGANYVMANQYQANASVSALADNATLSAPSVSVTPESGTYADSVTVNALFDDTTFELLYREDRPDTSWQPLTSPLTIGYDSSWVFYARNLNGGTNGPLITRSYSFSVSPDDIDSDGDGVPDYVERENNLDPGAGPDSDFDFQSDLEELLAGTDPNDPDSTTPEGSRNPPYLGEGFYLYAQAYNQTTGIASPYDDNGTPTDDDDDFPGERIKAYDMRSAYLASGNVDAIASGPLAGQFGARLDLTNAMAEREWLILASPIYFNLGTNPATAPRNGRETYRVMKRPVFPDLADGNPFSATGTDRETDATGWLAGMATAVANFNPVTSLTRLDPEDNAIAALAEQAIHASLLTLNTELTATDFAVLGISGYGDLGIPSDVADFTLFGDRDADAAKTPLSDLMIQGLILAGCDFSALIDFLDTSARANSDIVDLAEEIYARHAAVSDSTPNMALPLDTLRSVIRSGVIADPGMTVVTSYNPDGSIATTTTRTNPYATIPGSLITGAEGAMSSILGGVAATKRPVETWTVEIEAPTTLGHSYDYRRNSNSNLAWFVDSFGDRFILEQGLGLNLGAQFTITGYTDVSPVTGFDTMEIASIDMVVNPVATDSDSNGNLLDDEWERFFFGDIGVHGPFDPHPITGHSYFQYHLSGADPRAGDLTDPVITASPTDVCIVWLPAFNAYDIEFTFPDEYVSAVNFDLLSSNTITAFGGPVQVGGVTSLGSNRHSLRVSSPDSNLTRNFFQIEMSLAD